VSVALKEFGGEGMEEMAIFVDTSTNCLIASM
jgi:hypothetical protein